MTLLEPHDLPAEQAVLGAMMLSPAEAENVRRILVPSDFYRPAHQLIFEAILAVMNDGTIADPVVMNDHLTRRGEIPRVGGAPYLHTLIASVPVVAQARVYASTVRRHAVTRRLRDAGRRILQWTDSADMEEPGALTERVLREVQSVRDEGAGGATGAVPVADFLSASGSDEYDWVLRDLMERGDRLVLTGVEGGGKSEFLRQLAVMSAAGIQPFSLVRSQPMRALLLDAENGERMARRKLRPLVALADRQGRPVEDRLWVQCVPGGVDLATDRGVSWLLREVTAAKPDFLLLGPLYKLVPRAIKDDDDAAPILAALDMVRARGICIALEGHAGHAIGPGGHRDMRPRGSAALLGWPEFGYGLRWADDSSRQCRVMDVVSWRGERDTDRMWPEKIMSNGIWPWSECV